jgi:hypothetical protein
MKFKIEQVAICPKDPAAAIELLTALGAAEWAHDNVVAVGTVYGDDGSNEANLAFNYTMDDCSKPMEFEVLQYTTPDNWMNHDERRNSVSHLGMHCTEEELDEFKAFFLSRSILIAQEVQTQSHTNPVIDGKRLYHYCIFDTKHILGVDLKFIVRQLIPQAVLVQL